MINLLPPDYTQQLKYQRLNAALTRWLAGTALAIGGLLLIIVIGSLYMNRQTANLNRNIAQSQQQLQAQHLAQVQKDAKEISGDIRVINQVLSREIRFSKLIPEIGGLMPPGTVLNSLTLTTVTGGIDLSAATTSNSAANQVAVNLSDPKNNLFDKIDIVNITCTKKPSYPCTGNYRAVFTKSAQSRFLTVAKEAKP